MSKDTLRMVIGFGLVLVILVAWQMLFRPKPRPAAPVPAAPAESVRAESAPRAPEVPRTIVSEEPAPAPRPAPVLEPGAALLPETTLALENELLRLEFTNVGAGLRSIWLKRYKAELVPAGATLFSAVAAREKDTVDFSTTPLSAFATDTSATFTFAAGGFSFERVFTLGPGYAVTMATRLEGGQGILLDAEPGLAVTEDNVKEDLSHVHFYARTNQKVQRIAPKGCKTPLVIPAGTDWVGLKSKYFLLAAVSREPGFESACATALPDGRIGFTASVRSTSSDIVLYLGPLHYDRLRSFRLGFEEAVSLGWAKPVALGILWLLKLLFRAFGNWGVAIIVFSILMKALFYPLTRTQTRQMRQMQMLQPKLAELKAKYKNDPQALNQETMQLYKLYKVNPLSGCLPMLVQLPVFWALYSVLRSFVELRGAKFVLWLNDLSQPDTLFGHLPFFGNPPIGLLPILMGVSFIAQNMLTTTDKKNWAMTIIFPIFITVIFLNFPSGLQLYWFMYNILSILESIFVMRGGRKWLMRILKPAHLQATT